MKIENLTHLSERKKKRSTIIIIQGSISQKCVDLNHLAVLGNGLKKTCFIFNSSDVLWSNI